MTRDKDFYWKLFKSTFIVSMFTVGGASVTLDPDVAPQHFDGSKQIAALKFFA